MLPRRSFLGAFISAVLATGIPWCKKAPAAQAAIKPRPPRERVYFAILPLDHAQCILLDVCDVTVKDVDKLLAFHACLAAVNIRDGLPFTLPKLHWTGRLYDSYTIRMDSVEAIEALMMLGDVFEMNEHDRYCWLRYVEYSVCSNGTIQYAVRINPERFAQYETCRKELVAEVRRRDKFIA